MKRWSLCWVRALLTGLLCLALGGCGLGFAQPPRAAVQEAIAQKLTQTQTTLFHQLDIPFDGAKAAQISSLRIADHRRTTLAGQPVVAVTGTYRLNGPNLSSAQKRQLRSFTVYLKKGTDPEKWRLANE